MVTEQDEPRKRRKYTTEERKTISVLRHDRSRRDHLYGMGKFLASPRVRFSVSFANSSSSSERLTFPPRPIKPERTMDRLLLLLLGILRSACRCRADLVLENAALRHQLGVLMQARSRPRVTAADRG